MNTNDNNESDSDGMGDEYSEDDDVSGAEEIEELEEEEEEQNNNNNNKSDVYKQEFRKQGWKHGSALFQYDNRKFPNNFKFGPQQIPFSGENTTPDEIFNLIFR